MLGKPRTMAGSGLRQGKAHVRMPNVCCFSHMLKAARSWPERGDKTSRGGGGA